jgi:hypothetical protein
LGGDAGHGASSNANAPLALTLTPPNIGSTTTPALVNVPLSAPPFAASAVNVTPQPWIDSSPGALARSASARRA